ncbi:MAG: hypothetical protein KKB20_11505 [Proteobacteria bacterium]|nr:hypothetical protein [Pseudomonadota bacterium]
MARPGKIEQFQLGPRILNLITVEGKTTHEVAAILTEAGFPISQPTVARWLKERREEVANKTVAIFQEHVEKELPKDLEALEAMEVQLLAWAGEAPDSRAARVAAWERVNESIDEIIREFDGLKIKDDKGRAEWAKAFVARVAKWLLEDGADQKTRRASMKLATEIIATKLRFSGIIEGAEAGAIYINKAPDSSGSPKPDGGPSDNSGNSRRLLLVKGDPDA